MRTFFKTLDTRKRAQSRRRLRPLRKQSKKEGNPSLIRNDAVSSKLCALTKKLKALEEFDESHLKRESKRVVSRLDAALARDCNGDRNITSVILLADYAYDASRSGTPMQCNAILHVLKQTLKRSNRNMQYSSSLSPSPSSSSLSWDNLKSISRAAFLLALSGVSMEELYEQLSTYMLAVLYSIIAVKKIGCAGRVSPEDYFFIADNLAAAGYEEFDSTIMIFFSKLEEQVQGKTSHRSLCNRGGLFHPSGYGLQTLWLHSTKQKKIRVSRGSKHTINRGNGVLMFKDWDGDPPIFDDDSKQLIVDIGCGFGVSLLGMARNDEGNGTRDESKYNYIGCDLSVHAINYARGLSKRWGLSKRCKYVAAPALELFEHLKCYYSGKIICVLIQFPSPFKFSNGAEEDVKSNCNRQLPNSKDDDSGFMVTTALINSVLGGIANKGLLYAQSNVEDVAVFMKQTTESCANRRDDVELGYACKVDAKALNCFVIIDHGESHTRHNTQEILKDMDEGEDSVTKRSKAYHATGRELAQGDGWYDQGTSPLALYARTETEASYAIQNKRVYRVAWIVTRK